MQYKGHLRKYDPATGAIDPKEGWIINNQFLYSDDNFKTVKSVFGEYTIDDETKWGLLAEAVMAGYVAGCTIDGGVIRIGKQADGTYAFEVDENGNVSMLGGDIKFTNDTNSLNDTYNTLNNRIDNTDATITETHNTLNNRINETNATITRTKESIEAEVSRVENALSSSIKINADAITSKVETNNFGTLIEQNYDHVKIAWNQNSNYIKFEDGQMNIYTSSTNSTNNLLVKHSYDGAWYYRKGLRLGKIGTNSYVDDDSYRGLIFDLEYDGNYMCWAAKDTADDDSYNVKLIYHNKDTREKKGLHFKCHTYANGYLHLTDDDKFKIWTNGGCGYDGRMTWCDKNNVSYVEINGPSKQFNVYDGCNFNTNTICDFTLRDGSNFYMQKSDTAGGSTFAIGNNVQIDIWNNINMHDWNLIDTSITQSSDARLKTNIQDTDVDALSVINQIEMKQFDWIESAKHEDLGMIAQQLQMVAPDFVYTDENTGKLSIKVNRFIPYLIKSIQELTEYVTGDTSTFTLRKNWEDTYTIEEKRQFILDTSCSEIDSNNNTDQHIEIELIPQSIQLPVDQKGEHNNE